MSDSYLSTIWYRVAGLRPRLRAHVSVHRHRYRGRPWYVLHDHGAGRIHRFTPAAYMLVGQLDGTRTVDDVWHALAERHEADAPSQDDVIRLLSRLHQNDLIQYPGSPDVAELLERYDRQSRQVAMQNLLNPVSIRVPLWDPDRFLARTLPAVRWLTGRFGLALWLAVVAWGAVTAFMHWPDLSANFADRMLAAENLVIALVCYPLLKALHELTHGWLAKARGAEVREMGIMFLVFFPVPYVDASAAAAFRSKWQRAAVSAGGIFAETAVAALAIVFWASAETGFASAVAYNLAVIGGLSTLVVNGNPLLKFDGYYILSDVVEIPNLSTRASRYWGHLIQRHLFGARQLREEIATPGERAWFVLYAPAAFVYRLSVMIGIAMFVASKYLIVGVAIASLSIFNAIVRPSFKHLRHVLTAAQLRKVRRRAVSVTFGTIGAVTAAALLIPLPLHTDSEGVVWLPEAAHLRAGTTGFVDEIRVDRGAEVDAAQPVLTLAEPTLDARIEALSWRAEEQRRRLAVAEIADRPGAEVARLELADARAELDRERARALDLVVRAPVAGRFEPAVPVEDLPGRFLSEGDLIGYVLPPEPEVVRIVVSQDDVALVRERLSRVELKLAGLLEERHEARLVREAPSAQLSLPSPALGRGGGGRILTDPSDPEGLKAMEQLFVLDVAMPETMRDAAFGTRVHVRFAHGTEPAAFQLARRVRQLFLRQFGA